MASDSDLHEKEYSERPWRNVGGVPRTPNRSMIHVALWERAPTWRPNRSPIIGIPCALYTRGYEAAARWSRRLGAYDSRYGVMARQDLFDTAPADESVTMTEPVYVKFVTSIQLLVCSGSDPIVHRRHTACRPRRRVGPLGSAQNGQPCRSIRAVLVQRHPTWRTAIRP